MRTDPPNAGLTYQGKPRTWGFRFSVTDAIVLLVSILLTITTWTFTSGYAVLIPFVVLHFFLFCNIFRIRPKLEFIWAGLLVLNAAAWVFSGEFSLWGMMGIQFAATAAVIIAEICSPRYHGIFARRINPRLDDYLSGKV